jgi:hypothetical protein
MVLVAPQTASHEEGGETAKRGLRVVQGRTPEGGVLELLRADGLARLPSSAGLAGGLRAWLEDAAYAAVRVRGEDAPALVLGSRQLLGPAAVVNVAATSPGPGDIGDGAMSEPDPPHGVVVARLVHALFRQIMTVGALDDPLRDAVDALGARGGRAEGAVRYIEALPAAERRSLGEAVGAHASHLLELLPRPLPEWLPRTDERVAIPLAGGGVVLQGVFDLVVDVPQERGPARGALALSTDGAWGRARRSLHYLALLDTLRSGRPPFRLAQVDSSTGRFGAEDVREEHLRVMTAHVCAWLAGASWGAGVGGCLTR